MLNAHTLFACTLYSNISIRSFEKEVHEFMYEHFFLSHSKISIRDSIQYYHFYFDSIRLRSGFIWYTRLLVQLNVFSLFSLHLTCNRRIVEWSLFTYKNRRNEEENPLHQRRSTLVALFRRQLYGINKYCRLVNGWQYLSSSLSSLLADWC